MGQLPSGNPGVGRFVNAAASWRVAHGKLMYLSSRGGDTSKATPFIGNLTAPV
jgi:hypothetical protein